MDYFDILLAKKLEDDRDPKVEGLSVTENGRYHEDGVVYDPVIVALPLDKKTITANGTYKASDDDLEGYNEVEVEVPMPANAYLLKSATSYPITPSLLPLPKAEVTFEGNKAELYVGSEPIVVAEDNAPYVYRQSPQNKSAVDVSLVGGTVAWNQLVQNGNFANTSRWDFPSGTFSVADNIGTFTAQSQGQQVTQTIPYILNHKYLGIMQIKTTSATESVWLRFYGQNKVHTVASTNWQTVATIVNSIVDSTNSFGVRDDRSSGWDAIQIKNANLFDLTQAFGSTIADYVYSLEQATAGSGIAWLKSYGYLTKDYYAYQSGKLESVNVASRKVYDSNDTLLATYNFDATKVLRGIPKLSNGQMYYDGDVYNSDGTITRNYEERAYQSGDESLTDAITDGTNTVVKLSTPTTESATPFTNPQLVGSTEEFTDGATRDVMIPCGQDSNYANSDIYISYGTSPIDMAKEHFIVPYPSTYIDSNGSEDVEYWEEVVS